MKTKLQITWQDVSRGVDKNNLPWCLGENIFDLPIDEVRLGLVDAWTFPEWPSRSADNITWVAMFNYGFDEQEGYLDDEGNVQPWDNLPEVITLFRGAHKDYSEGLSWTSSLERAEWFANRLGQEDMAVYKIEIPRELVLAKFDNRGEDEYVVEVIRLLEDDIELFENYSIKKIDVSDYFFDILEKGSK